MKAESRSYRTEGRGPRAEERRHSRESGNPSVLHPVDATNPSALEKIARVFRQIIGAPDYERYLEHQHTCHPDQVPLSRDEFARERLADRYSRPGTRCC